jgi:MscS family membrane protein
MVRFTRVLGVWLVWLLRVAAAEDPEHPLRPTDRSSPRAALKTFLADADSIGSFLAQEYLPAPNQERFGRLVVLANTLLPALDLREVPPVARPKVGRVKATALYEVLNRIPLPPEAEIPDLAAIGAPNGTNDQKWVIPNTEITLIRSPQIGTGDQFVFSAETVARADEFFQRVRNRPNLRPVPLPNLTETFVRGGGWMIPHGWLMSLPSWMMRPVLHQAVWKWLALGVLMLLFVGFIRPVYRLSKRGTAERPVRRAFAQLCLPAYFLLAAPVLAYFGLVQINLRDALANWLEFGATGMLYLAGAWISWRIAPVVAEAIIASPRIAPESIDAHLIRICTRLLGIFAGAALLALGADRLGLPVYGIIAGLGVGGLAIALAAQPTIENLIGGLSLFADKSLRVGDFCRCGTDEGTVEAIGIRSTWIRGVDRTLTTIPNAALSKMPVINFGRRDECLLQTVVGVRYETKPDQLRRLIDELREMLLAHPELDPESVRVRLVGLGPSSLDIEVFAYVDTRERAQFMSVREDILLKIIDLVESCGTGFAFPSQTLYLARDQAPSTPLN